MRFFLVIPSLFYFAFAASPLAVSDSKMVQPQNQLDAQSLFVEFMKQYSKSYRSEDIFHRFNNFKDNLNIIHNHNAGNHLYRLGINQFADMTNEEFLKVFSGSEKRFRDQEKKYADAREFGYSYAPPYPLSVDWRDNSYLTVTPVKNQLQCDSGWAFSASGAVEGAWGSMNFTLPDPLGVSEQELLDCSAATNSCNGGSTFDAFEYVLASGISTESSYPYTGKKGSCEASKGTPAGLKFGGAKHFFLDEDTMKSLVARRPISVMLNAASSSFQLYSGGVLSNDCNQTPLNHAALVVGYGTGAIDHGILVDYWLVKNSWGSSWGEQGYIRILRDGNNLCGILSAASMIYVE